MWVLTLRMAILALVILMILVPVSATSISSSPKSSNILVKGDNNTTYGRLAVLIVLDAVNYTVFGELLNAGYLPNFQRLISSGKLVVGKTIIPSATTAAWTALFTGAPPEINGVVNTYAINATYYHELPPDMEPETVGYSQMIQAESLVEVLNEKNIKIGFVYTESKVAVALGKEGRASISMYYPEPFDPYDPSLPIAFRESYLDDLTNVSISIIKTFSSAVKEGEKALVVIDYPEPDASGHTHGPMSSYYKDVLEIIDSEIGRIIDYLNESGLWEKTLMIVTTDHSMIQTNSEYNVLTTDEKHIVGLPIEHRVVPIGTLACIYLKHEEDLEVAVDYLSKIDWIEGIWARKAVPNINGTLADIGLNITYAGDIVVSLKTPYYAYTFESKGAHGGVNTLTVPIIFSGGTFNKSVVIPDNISITDIAPTLAGFLAVRKPSNAVGRDLGVYTNFADVLVSANPAIAKPSQNITINITYAMRFAETATLSMKVTNAKTNETIITRDIQLSLKSGVELVNISVSYEGEYMVEVVITSASGVLGRGFTKILIIKEVKPGTPPEVYYAFAISIVFGIIIVATPFLVKKFLMGPKHVE